MNSDRCAVALATLLTNQKFPEALAEPVLALKGI